MRLMLTGAALAALTACMSPTPYERAGPFDETGYDSERVGTDTYRVSFEGNDVTSRQTVETYLLYRAAQVTQNTGHDYFRFVSRDTDEEIELDAYNTYRTSPGLYGYGIGGYDYTYPYYSTFPYTTTNVGLTPYSETVLTTDDSYEAQAVIELFEERPADTRDVLNASDVIARLDSRIRRNDEGFSIR